MDQIYLFQTILFLTMFDTEKCSLTFVTPALHHGVLGSLPRHTVHKGTGVVSRHRGPRAPDFDISGTLVGCTSLQVLPKEVSMVWWGEIITGIVSSSFSEINMQKRFN